MAYPFLMKYSKKLLLFYTNHYFILFEVQFKANRIIKKHVFVTTHLFSVLAIDLSLLTDLPCHRSFASSFNFNSVLQYSLRNTVIYF